MTEWLSLLHQQKFLAMEGREGGGVGGCMCDVRSGVWCVCVPEPSSRLVSVLRHCIVLQEAMTTMFSLISSRSFSTLRLRASCFCEVYHVSTASRCDLT